MRIRNIIVFIVLLSALSACVTSQLENPSNHSSGDDPIISESLTSEEMSTLTPTSSATKTALPTSTHTPTSVPPTSTLTPTASPTPEPLEVFSSPHLRTGITPVTYIEDVCSYLENRWGADKSEPGTIVVPFMFHSIAKPGRTIRDNTTISMERFEYFMARAKELGFSTITTEELIGFLYENEKIPQRSMILIKDDRSAGVTELFMPYLEEFDWTLTLAWPTTDLTGDDLWDMITFISRTIPLLKRSKRRYTDRLRSFKSILAQNLKQSFGLAAILLRNQLQWLRKPGLNWDFRCTQMGRSCITGSLSGKNKS